MVLASHALLFYSGYLIRTVIQMLITARINKILFFTSHLKLGQLNLNNILIRKNDIRYKLTPKTYYLKNK